MRVRGKPQYSRDCPRNFLNKGTLSAMGCMPPIHEPYPASCGHWTLAVASRARSPADKNARASIYLIRAHIPMIWYPQSTKSTWPVMAAAPSLARKVPVAPSSSGSTFLFSGECAS
jgi:hypothetical protein